MAIVKKQQTVKKTDSVVPAADSAPMVVPLPEVQEGLAAITRQMKALKNTPLAADAAFLQLERVVASVQKQMQRAAIDVTVPLEQKEKISGAPAIIVRRSVGEAIERGDLKPGQRLSGSEILLVNVWEPVSHAGELLGRRIASFIGPENLSDTPQYFNKNAADIGALNRHGYKGWQCDVGTPGAPRYEDALFAGLKNGSALGHWAIPQLPVLSGRDRNGEQITKNHLLAFNMDKDSPLYGKLVKPVVLDGQQSLHSCTADPYGFGYVIPVLVPDGKSVWDRTDEQGGHLCVRPSIALPLNHRIP